MECFQPENLYKSKIYKMLIAPYELGTGVHDPKKQIPGIYNHHKFMELCKLLKQLMEDRSLWIKYGLRSMFIANRIRFFVHHNVFRGIEIIYHDRVLKLYNDVTSPIRLRSDKKGKMRKHVEDLRTADDDTIPADPEKIKELYGIRPEPLRGSDAEALFRELVGSSADAFPEIQTRGTTVEERDQVSSSVDRVMEVECDDRPISLPREDAQEPSHVVVPSPTRAEDPSTISTSLVIAPSTSRIMHPVAISTTEPSRAVALSPIMLDEIIPFEVYEERLKKEAAIEESRRRRQLYQQKSSRELEARDYDRPPTLYRVPVYGVEESSDNEIAPRIIYAAEVHSEPCLEARTREVEIVGQIPSVPAEPCLEREVEIVGQIPSVPAEPCLEREVEIVGQIPSVPAEPCLEMWTREVEIVDRIPSPVPADLAILQPLPAVQAEPCLETRTREAEIVDIIPSPAPTDLVIDQPLPEILISDVDVPPEQQEPMEPPPLQLDQNIFPDIVPSTQEEAIVPESGHEDVHVRENLPTESIQELENVVVPANVPVPEPSPVLLRDAIHWDEPQPRPPKRRRVNPEFRCRFNMETLKKRYNRTVPRQPYISPLEVIDWVEDDRSLMNHYNLRYMYDEDYLISRDIEDIVKIIELGSPDLNLVNIYEEEYSESRPAPELWFIIPHKDGESVDIGPGPEIVCDEAAFYDDVVRHDPQRARQSELCVLVFDSIRKSFEKGQTLVQTGRKSSCMSAVINMMRDHLGIREPRLSVAQPDQSILDARISEVPLQQPPIEVLAEVARSRRDDAQEHLVAVKLPVEKIVSVPPEEAVVETPTITVSREVRDENVQLDLIQPSDAPLTEREIREEIPLSEMIQPSVAPLIGENIPAYREEPQLPLTTQLAVEPILEERILEEQREICADVQRAEMIQPTVALLDEENIPAYREAPQLPLTTQVAVEPLLEQRILEEQREIRREVQRAEMIRITPPPQTEVRISAISEEVDEQGRMAQVVAETETEVVARQPAGEIEAEHRQNEIALVDAMSKELPAGEFTGEREGIPVTISCEPPRELPVEEQIVIEAQQPIQDTEEVPEEPIEPRPRVSKIEIERKLKELYEIGNNNPISFTALCPEQTTSKYVAAVTIHRLLFMRRENRILLEIDEDIRITNDAILIHPRID